MRRDEAMVRALRAAYQSVGLAGTEVACLRYRRAVEEAIKQLASDGWVLIFNGGTSATRCEITDLLTTECAHCKHPEPSAKPAERRDLGPRFAAQYGGECSDCGDEFEQGDRIRADGVGGWLAAPCGDEPVHVETFDGLIAP